MKTTLLFLFLALASCNKDNSNTQQNTVNTLPSITTSGANTFGCKINGIVMVPRNSIGYIPPGSTHNPASYQKGTNYSFESIDAVDRRKETKSGGVYLYFQSQPVITTPTTTGIQPIYNGISPFEIGFNDHYKNYIYITRYVNNVAQFYVSIENTGTYKILKSDLIIISGTFSCKAVNLNNPNDIINVTEGRFDVTKNTLITTNFP